MNSMLKCIRQWSTLLSPTRFSSLSSTHLPCCVGSSYGIGHPGSSYLLARPVAHVYSVNKKSLPLRYNSDRSQLPPPGKDGSGDGGGDFRLLQRVGKFIREYGVIGLVATGVVTYLHDRRREYIEFEAERRRELVERSKESVEYITDVLCENLQNSKLDELKVDFFVPTMDMKAIRERVCGRLEYHTHLVCGPRGVGKSTAVRKALENEESVAVIDLHPCSLENLYSSIMQVANLKHHDIDKKAIVAKALGKIQKRGGKKPTFVVEVNDQCTAESLTPVVIQLKEWCSDNRLANFVLVLSSSRSALLIPIGLSLLRMNELYIGDPEEKVIFDFLYQYLNKFPEATNQQKEEFIAHFTEQLGTRFLDAHDLIVECDRAKCSSMVQVKQQSVKFISSRVEQYKMAFDEFAELLRATKSKQLLKQLLNEEILFSDMCKQMNVSQKQLLEILATIHPHPLYVHPMSRRVSMGNVVAQKELKILIEAM